jgi:hypothetical protein
VAFAPHTSFKHTSLNLKQKSPLINGVSYSGKFCVSENFRVSSFGRDGSLLSSFKSSKYLQMSMIFLIAQWFSLALRIRAHGDHSHDLYMGPEHLAYYDQVPDNAFKKIDQDQIVGTFQFKER